MRLPFLRRSTLTSATAASPAPFNRDGVALCNTIPGYEPPPAHERFVSIKVGNFTACGLRDDGYVLCWGTNTAVSPDQDGFTSISIGGSYCGLRGDGEAVCWAYRNDYPKPPQGKKFSELSVGGEWLRAGHVCAIQHDGVVVCWGDDDKGQASPPENIRFKSISAGYYHTCGLTEDGRIVCWGDNSHHQTNPPMR